MNGNKTASESVSQRKKILVYKKGSQKIKSFLFSRKIHRRFKILFVLFCFSTILRINYRDLANLVLKLHFFKEAHFKSQCAVNGR